ncbi:MAG: AraC family transcriptional regulator [Caulobacterales bacterium]|nr:AraC family transcriptional regulator [Caulobacterales bacterium]
MRILPRRERARAGFADAPTFSKAFSKRFGASPSAYRRSFAGLRVDP